MLEAIIGDIVGSVYEFGNHRAKTFEPFFHRQASYMVWSMHAARSNMKLGNAHPSSHRREFHNRGILTTSNLQ